MFKRSVISNITQAIVGFTLLLLLSSSIALLTLFSNAYDAELLKISSSLQKQIYQLSCDPIKNLSKRQYHLYLYLEKLNELEKHKVNHIWISNKIRKFSQALMNAWPLMQHAVMRNDVQYCQQQIVKNLDYIDQFVASIQRYADIKIRLVIFCNIIGLFAAILLTIWILRLIRRDVIHPLNALVTASRYIKNGDFTFPALDTHYENELGELSMSFNSMASRLHQHYTVLEATVKEQTKDLIQANHTLGILYEASQILTSGHLELNVFEQILVLLKEREQFSCIAIEMENCEELIQGRPSNDLKWWALPLRQGKLIHGVLRWQAAHNSYSITLMQSVANMLGRAVVAYHSQKQYQQMLLIEERATIARELHDSLAQALSFMRIQLTLLKLKTTEVDSEAKQIIADFDRTLASTWRQLRELLTTFRLNIEETNLDAAMQTMIAELQEKSDAKISYSAELGLQSLDAQQQVHVLQIVREALLNAIRHAFANEIKVTYQRTHTGEHQLMVSDDGVGIGNAEEPAGHYGLTIMNERAQRLGAKLAIKQQMSGTLVLLSFPSGLHFVSD